MVGTPLGGGRISVQKFRKYCLRLRKFHFITRNVCVIIINFHNLAIFIQTCRHFHRNLLGFHLKSTIFAILLNFVEPLKCFNFFITIRFSAFEAPSLPRKLMVSVLNSKQGKSWSQSRYQISKFKSHDLSLRIES